MNRIAAFAPLALLVIIMIAAGFVLMRGGARETVSAGDAERLAPAYALTALDGGAAISSEAFAGEPYVINFFASWCTPCRAEHPQLMAMQAQGVRIVGVAYKDRPENAQRFLDQLGDPFEATALDPDGRFALELGVAGAVPETFAIGDDGRIRAVHRGPLTEAVVREQILPALAR
ncbi:MAG: DsbE family thiol:disulfide interchange protein [Hyphomonadaceae bacterium]